VEALLKAHEEAGGFLAEAPRGGSTPSPVRPVAGGGEVAGAVIGRYKLIEEIGHGGFGVVWRAEQLEPVRRQVALKVIKLGMDTKQVVARFEAERQALALMDHPHIAKVLDGGVTPSGRPFFVMELVQGVPITEFCDRAGLDTRSRLELFAEVCHAVQHAHQKGVIHRDLKPSNVMVTLRGDRPVPKVIDFGIVKATDQRLTERTLFTEYGQFMGTPAYMSPEQAEMSGLDVDTRSDIYSLGVLLYELLTGVPPFEPERLRQAGYEELLRIIREEEPPRPSTQVSTLGAAPAAGRCGLDPEVLARRLRGDLDWIVLKSLEKDRTRRYGTASEFAADVMRHLRDEPVMASPPSVAYRLHKLVRRNRGKVAAAGMVTVVLLLGTLGTGLGLLSANRAKRDLENALTQMTQERNRAVAAENQARKSEEEARTRAVEAQRNADITAAINRFLNEDLLATVAPSMEQGRGKDVGMQEVLRAAAERIARASSPGGAFENRPVVEAAVRHTVGATYHRLGDDESARPHLRRALELRSRLLGPTHRDTGETAGMLARLNLRQGDFDRARELFEQARLAARAAWGEGSVEAVRASHGLALVALSRDRVSEAEGILREAVKSLRGNGPREDDLRTIVLGSLAGCLARLSHLEEAVSLQEEAVALARKLHGRDSPRTLAVRANLVDVLVASHRLDEGERILRDVLSICTGVLGSDHPATLHYQVRLARIYRLQKRRDDARALLKRTIRAQEARHGLDHADALTALIELGALYLDEGRLDRATVMFEKAAETSRRVRGENHPATIALLTDVGNLHIRCGNWKKAEHALNETLKVLRRTHGPESPLLLRTELGLVRVERERGRFDRATERLGDLLDRGLRALGAGDALIDSMVTAAATLAGVMEEKGHGREAIAFLHAAMTTVGDHGELRARLEAARVGLLEK